MRYRILGVLLCLIMGVKTPLMQMTSAMASDEALAISDGQRDACLEVLRAAMVGDEFWPAMHAAEALTLAGRADEVQQPLTTRLLTERDDRRRCGLARELVRSGDLAKVGMLLEILEKSDTYGHEHAAESLYKIGEVGDGRGTAGGARQRVVGASPPDGGRSARALRQRKCARARTKGVNCFRPHVASCGGMEPKHTCRRVGCSRLASPCTAGSGRDDAKLCLRHTCDAG